MQADPQPLTISQVARARYKVLGAGFDAVQIDDVVRQMEGWIAARDRAHYVCVSNVHSVVESQYDGGLKSALNTSDLNVPDGMPIVWMGRLYGHRLRRRVYGPELFAQFLHATRGKGYKHFFYGSTPDTLAALVQNLEASFPDLRSAASYSPPFRRLTPAEDCEIVARINEARPDVLWAGLGCPKQELWMAEHCRLLRVPVMVGIGQAFNLYAGNLRQAPRWMRENGLEWLFRLCLEPRRLWRRYFIYNTVFLYCLLLESIGLKHFE